MKSAEPKTKRIMPIPTGQTGPKTPEGKARSSCNAIKHGRSANIPEGIQGSAEAAMFKTCKQRLFAEYLPDGELEQFFVVQIAMAMVRQSRLWTLESKMHDALTSHAVPPDPEGAIALPQISPIKPNEMAKQNVNLQKELDGAIVRLQRLQASRRNRAERAARRGV